jgi:hypothetical protein
MCKCQCLGDPRTWRFYSYHRPLGPYCPFSSGLFLCTESSSNGRIAVLSLCRPVGRHLQRKWSIDSRLTYRTLTTRNYSLKVGKLLSEVTIAVHDQNVSFLFLNNLQVTWNDWHYFEFTVLHGCNCFANVHPMCWYYFHTLCLFPCS